MPVTLIYRRYSSYALLYMYIFLLFNVVMACSMYSGTLWQLKYINIDCTTLYQDPQEGCDWTTAASFLTCLAKTRRNVHAINNLITVFFSQCEHKWVNLCRDCQPRGLWELLVCVMGCAVEGLNPKHWYRANRSQKASHAKKQYIWILLFS